MLSNLFSAGYVPMELSTCGVMYALLYMHGVVFFSFRVVRIIAWDVCAHVIAALRDTEEENAEIWNGRKLGDASEIRKDM